MTTRDLKKPALHPHFLNIADTMPSHSVIALMFSHIFYTWPRVRVKVEPAYFESKVLHFVGCVMTW